MQLVQPVNTGTHQIWMNVISAYIFVVAVIMDCYFIIQRTNSSFITHLYNLSTMYLCIATWCIAFNFSLVLSSPGRNHFVIIIDIIIIPCTMENTITCILIACDPEMHSFERSVRANLTRVCVWVCDDPLPSLTTLTRCHSYHASINVCWNLLLLLTNTLY